MPATAPMPPLPEVTLPLAELVPAHQRHYFTGRAGMRYFSTRCYTFGRSVQYMPLVRAFLDTCAAEHSGDFRYLFTLLGSELANNALTHSRSGEPYGVYTLKCERRDNGLRLTCRDQGAKATAQDTPGRFEYLSTDASRLNSEAESGRGLAMVEALATSWGDNGFTGTRQVWFFLAADLSGSRWNALL
ncbi:ATP-binding protein [Nocardiopsis nanhaiensis]